MPTPADLLTASRRYLGVPYLYGGKTPAALDCSGLISLACRDVGVSVPAGSAAQIAACTPISVAQARTTPGALLWREGHDGLSTGAGTVIEARTPVVVEGAWSDTYGGKPRWTRAGLIPGITYQEEPMTKMISPVEGRVSSEYGTRNGTLHAGIDISGSGASKPVYAAFAGVVERVVRGRKHGQAASVGTVLAPGRTGNGVLVRNPDGERQLYGHVAADAAIVAGKKIAAGTRLGNTDMSGNTTGYHLHFETWNSAGKTVNPRVYFNHHGVTPGSKPAITTSGGAPYAVLRVDGSLGALTVKAWQYVMRGIGTYSGTIDGKRGALTVKAIQSWLKQKGYYKGLVDGSWGTVSVKALQSLLKARGFYKGLIDGSEGSMTIKAEQAFLNDQRRTWK